MEEQPKTKKSGGVKKRDQSVVKIAEATGSILTPDILSVADMDGWPSLREENEKNQLIVLASACGISQPFIARAFGISQPVVNVILKRIDPDSKFRLDPKARAAFMTQMFEMRGIEALASITPEKLADSSAVELARIAKTMMDAKQALNVSKHKNIGTSRMAMLNEQLEAEAVDAEFEELGDD